MALTPTRVWLSVDDTDAHVPARELSRSAQRVRLELWRPDGSSAPRELTVSLQRLRELPPLTGDPERTVDDLVSLPDICLPAVLHNLRLRFAADLIYTAIGPVLISINPHKRLGDLGGFLSYLASLDEKEADELPPHIYRLARSAYTALARTGTSQSILVSGESGAGKTEACKLVVACLTELAPSGNVGATEAALQGAQMLEVWGNATTTQNHNSSRFGKWLAVHFDHDSGAISRCSLQPYLLEKSRVVAHSPGERSYHVFYQMTAGIRGEERRRRLGLGDAEHARDAHERFTYLTPKLASGEQQGANERVLRFAAEAAPQLRGSAASFDAAQWRETVGRLKNIGLDECMIDYVTNALAAILALGNLVMYPAKEGGFGVSPPSSPTARESRSVRAPNTRVAEAIVVASGIAGGAGIGEHGLQLAASLLEVDAAALHESLVSRKIVVGAGGLGAGSDAGSDGLVKPLSLAECDDTRDALAKEIYARLFHWLVLKLNEHMQGQRADAGSTHPSSGTSVAGAVTGRFIGILDIFGFENFSRNGFEQLCINYANEKLQKQFIVAAAELCLRDYKAEGIACHALTDCPDNAAQIALLEGPTGILRMLDEECALPRGSERSLVEKLDRLHAAGAIYARPPPSSSRSTRTLASSGADRAPRHSHGGNVAAAPPPAPQFAIRHYAAEVVYTVDGWVERNKGLLRPTLQVLLANSHSLLLQTLFRAESSRPSTTSCVRDRGASHRPTAARTRSTVVAGFRASLADLSATLEGTAAHFVRCIKPNKKQEPDEFDGEHVCRQLACTGVLAVVDVQRLGFPVSMPKQEFLRVYACITSGAGQARGLSHTFSADGEGAIHDNTTSLDEACSSLLLAAAKLLHEPEAWVEEGSRLGKTKIFLREAVVSKLELAKSEAWGAAATPIQTIARAHIARRARRALVAIEAAKAAARKALREWREALSNGERSMSAAPVWQSEASCDGVWRGTSSRKLHEARQWLEELVTLWRDCGEALAITLTSASYAAMQRCNTALEDEVEAAAVRQKELESQAAERDAELARKIAEEEAQAKRISCHAAEEEQEEVELKPQVRGEGRMPSELAVAKEERHTEVVNAAELSALERRVVATKDPIEMNDRAEDASTAICTAFRLDLTASGFGVCKCGAPRAEHTEGARHRPPIGAALGTLAICKPINVPEGCLDIVKTSHRHAGDPYEETFRPNRIEGVDPGEGGDGKDAAEEDKQPEKAISISDARDKENGSLAPMRSASRQQSNDGRTGIGKVLGSATARLFGARSRTTGGDGDRSTVGHCSCTEYRVDIASTSFGMCVCGAAKNLHTPAALLGGARRGSSRKIAELSRRLEAEAMPALAERYAQRMVVPASPPPLERDAEQGPPRDAKGGTGGGGIAFGALFGRWGSSRSLSKKAIGTGKVAEGDAANIATSQSSAQSKFRTSRPDGPSKDSSRPDLVASITPKDGRGSIHGEDVTGDALVPAGGLPADNMERQGALAPRAHEKINSHSQAVAPSFKCPTPISPANAINCRGQSSPNDVPTKPCGYSGTPRENEHGSANDEAALTKTFLSPTMGSTGSASDDLNTPYYTARRLVPITRPYTYRQEKDEVLEAMKSSARQGSVRALAASLGAQFNPAAPPPKLPSASSEVRAAYSGSVATEDTMSTTGLVEAPGLIREMTPLDLTPTVSRPRRAEGVRPRTRKPQREVAGQ